MLLAGRQHLDNQSEGSSQDVCKMLLNVNQSATMATQSSPTSIRKLLILIKYMTWILFVCVCVKSLSYMSGCHLHQCCVVLCRAHGIWPGMNQRSLFVGLSFMLLQRPQFVKRLFYSPLWKINLFELAAVTYSGKQHFAQIRKRAKKKRKQRCLITQPREHHSELSHSSVSKSKIFRASEH